MKYSEIKQVKELTGDDWRDLVQGMCDHEDDIFSGNWRAISEDDIDNIQCEELASDLYVLGCFNDWFLADVLGIDCDAIKAMQEAEAFEAIGKLVVSMGKLEELQQEYSRFDGYGHHFNPYDGSEEEIAGYYIFRTN